MPPASPGRRGAASRGAVEAVAGRRERRLAATFLVSWGLALSLTGLAARAAGPQRITRPAGPSLPPAAPLPVEVVPTPPADWMTGGGLPQAGELGVVGPPGVTTGPSERTASDPPASQPGMEPGSGPLPNANAPVTLRADDEDVRTVLGLLGRQAEVNILVSPAVQGAVRLDIQGATFRQALDAVLKMASLGARQEGGLVYVYTLAELDALRGRERQPTVRVYHLNYMRAADLQVMIQPFLSSEGAMTTTPSAAMGLGGGTAGLGGGAMSGAGGAAVGGGGGGPTAGGSASNAVDTGGNTMAYHDVVIVRDFPDNLAVIDQIVERVDVQPPQVLIEAVILSVRLRDDQELGVNFSIVDNLERMALVQGNGNAINAAAGFTPARVLAADVSRPGAGQLAPGYLSPLSPTQGLKFGFVSDNVTGFIRAVESFNKVNILASPRVLVLNKQRAEIQLGQRLGFRNTVTNLTSSLQTVEFLSVGTLLTLRPYVSSDGMIRMEIHPEKSTGALDNQGIPQTNTSELTTNILVPDGATIVIGGLIDDEDDVVEEGTPGLNRLPLVGALFRGRRTSSAKNEMIVLLTPRVLRHGGLPEPSPGVAPGGHLGIPNSGPMPGSSLFVPEGPISGPLLAPAESLRVGPSAGAADGLIGPSELPPAGAAPAPFGGRPGGAAPPPPVPDSPPAPAPADRPVPPVEADWPGAGAPSPPPALRPNPSPSPPAATRDPGAQAATLDGRSADSSRPAVASFAPAPAAAPPRRAIAGRTHTVRRGEDFASIARQYYGSPGLHRALWAANRATVPHPSSLRAGQVIIVPPAAALDLAAGEMPTPMTDRERADTPAPRQAAPRVAPPGAKPRFERLRHLWEGDRNGPAPAPEDGVRPRIRPSLEPAMKLSAAAPKLDPAVGRAAAVAMEPPAPEPRGYRPGDLTRGLLTRLRPESSAVAEEGAGDMPARLRRAAPAAAMPAASRVDPGVGTARALRLQSPPAESLLPSEEKRAPLRSRFAETMDGRRMGSF